MNNTEESKSRGRPSGTGSRSLSVADLALIVGDKGIGVPVPYRWLQSLGEDPNEYPKWDRSEMNKRLKAVAPAPVAETTEPTSVSEVEESAPEEEEVIEFTISQ